MTKQNLKYNPGTVSGLFLGFVGFILLGFWLFFLFFPCKFVELKYIFNCLTVGRISFLHMQQTWMLVALSHLEWKLICADTITAYCQPGQTPLSYVAWFK